MLFVVVIHTNPFEGLGPYGNAVNFALESSARFAVPFFFVTAGYFFALKTSRGDPTGYVLERVTAISSLYAFGILLSAPTFLAGNVLRANVQNRDVVSAFAHEGATYLSPLELVYYGTSVSEILWFLPALAFSFALVYAVVRLGAEEWLLPISLGLHVVGLLGASYTMFVDVPFQVRDALFFGFFYTSLGYHVYSNDWRPTPERSTLYLGATVLFGALHVGERYVLGYVLTGKTVAQGVYAPTYTVATALVTLSLFLFLLSRPRLGAGSPLPSWGRRYAVGIYVAHPPVLAALEGAGEVLHAQGYDATGALAWHLVSTPATFFGALLVYVAVRELRAVDGAALSVLRRIRNRDSV